MADDIQKNHSLYDIPIAQMDGSVTTLDPYRGQVLLIVNVASLCGFTPQYADLETLYRDYNTRGFTVLGFPCNQFSKQEPGGHEEIKAFATSCYRVSFPLFAKVEVKGSGQASLYAYLKKHMKKRPLKFIPWNFTKILVDAHGNVLKQYLPITSWKKIRKEVESLLPHEHDNTALY